MSLYSRLQGQVNPLYISLKSITSSPDYTIKISGFKAKAIRMGVGGAVAVVSYEPLKDLMAS